MAQKISIAEDIQLPSGNLFRETGISPVGEIRFFSEFPPPQLERKEFIRSYSRFANTWESDWMVRYPGK